MYKTLIESYYDVYENSLFLGEFSYDELSKLSRRHIEEAVYLVATQMQQQSIDVDEGLEYLSEALVDYGDVLYEDASLSFIEEQILYEIVDTLKQGAKGLVKSATHGAGYMTGLGVRAAKGLWRLFGKGYSRGRRGSYQGTSRGNASYRDDPYEYESDRGFSGSSGVRAAIGQAIRNRKSQQQREPEQPTPTSSQSSRTSSSEQTPPSMMTTNRRASDKIRSALQNRTQQSTPSPAPTPIPTARTPQQERIAELGKKRMQARAETQQRIKSSQARMKNPYSPLPNASRPVRVPAPPIPISSSAPSNRPNRTSAPSNRPVRIPAPPIPSSSSAPKLSTTRIKRT